MNNPHALHSDSSAVNREITGHTPNLTRLDSASCLEDPLQIDRLEPATLPAALQRAAQEASENGILHLQADGKEAFQSYAMLKDEAERILAGLRASGVLPQDKIIFQLEDSQDFLPAFWACVLGGIVPVPLSIAPSYERPNAPLGKLQNAWLTLGRPRILTGARLTASMQSLASLWNQPDVSALSVEEMRRFQPDHQWSDCRPDDLALLLLTSGSTGMPKAVMLSHRNMLARSAGTCRKNEFTDKDVSLNWFPLDHVGGIVMFHLRDVFLGCRQIHAPISLVLENPLRWLDWIERYSVTITWAPNFAYGLINDRAEEVAARRWNLSSLRFILNAGEAIVAKTARRFLELLIPHGLPDTSMHPAWGMSETSSAYTYSSRFHLSATSDTDLFVDVGTPIPGAAVRVVDAQDARVAEGVVGRLQVQGLSVTTGYYLNPEANRESFTADGWFKTGDLAVLNDGGSLTITGREKDVIIINGINYHSHEIEAVIEEVKGIEPSYTAACAVRAVGSETDKLAIFFHPIRSDWEFVTPLLKEVRNQVVTKIGLNPSYLLPVEKADIPKTAIGKIQRSQLRQRLEAGEFSETFKQLALHRAQEEDSAYAPPATDSERQIAALWQEVLALGRIGREDNFFELGGDSLTATQIISRIRGTFGVNLSLRHLFEGPTVAQLAQAVELCQIEEADFDEMAALLNELESLSEEDAKLLLGVSTH